MSTPPPPTASAETTLVVGSPPISPPPKRQKISASIDSAAVAAISSTSLPSTDNIPEATTASSSSAVPIPTTNIPETSTSVPAASTMDSSSIPPLQIKKLSASAKLPTRGSAFAAGYDLYASRDVVVPARGKALVDTDISMACPAGTYGRIAPRSGLASKHHIDTGAGVIDSDYRGPVKVLLFNHAETDFPVSSGDRVAQLVLERIVNPEVVEVQELEESVRGAGGFGSTGTN